jgi:hypothetical protein
LPTKTATALTGLGAFAIAMAVLTPAVAAPALKKAPLKEDVTTHSRSTAQILNAATGQLEPASVELIRHLTTARGSNGKALGSSSTAAYQELLTLTRVAPDGSVTTIDARGRFIGLTASKGVMAFDRSTGAGKVGKFGETYHTTGQIVKFPFNTKKGTYQYYDQTSGKAWPVSFTRTTKVDGLSVYEFKGTVPEQRLGQYGVLPNTEEIYSNAGRTVLVEPKTGEIVSSTTSPQISIQFADGSVKQALLVDSLVPTAATVKDRVDQAKSDKKMLGLLSLAPWLLGLLGLLLLGGAFGLNRRSRAHGEHPGSRPDVSGALPTPRGEPAVDPAKTRS